MHIYLISGQSDAVLTLRGRGRRLLTPPNGATSVEIMPVLMLMMPYPSARRRGRRGSDRGRRNRRRDRTRYHTWAMTSASSLKRNSGPAGRRSPFATLALSGNARPGWSAGSSCRPGRVAAAGDHLRAQRWHRQCSSTWPRLSSISGPVVTLSQAVANAQFFHRLLQLLGETVIHPVLDVQAVGADAGLPGVAELSTPAPSTALSRSASSKTINGALPPSSRETFLMSFAHCSISWRQSR